MDGKMKRDQGTWEKTSKRQAVDFSKFQTVDAMPTPFLSLAHLQRFRTDKCLIFSYWRGEDMNRGYFQVEDEGTTDTWVTYNVFQQFQPYPKYGIKPVFQKSIQNPLIDRYLFLIHCLCIGQLRMLTYSLKLYIENQLFKKQSDL